ncbi:tetraacyldisaccharide 4'-kinase [Stappia sp.]|uniref:tetraacyldisaccharide 4'-kinase n=1 Tax=Stappia sp. TaxID=1870903 RepID=UPI003C7CF593
MSGLRQAPAFWWRERPSALARLLQPVSAIYGAITARRMARAPKGRIDAPVICIGNFVAGGTGKTPFALALADLLAQKGRKPAFLLRGYGGNARGPLLVDPARHTAQDVGDEALLLAERAPTVVARDRVAGARLADGHGDIVLMDDGFQNPDLEKTVSLVLVDGETGIGNGLSLPSGPLRAPLARQLPFASAVIGIGEGPAGERVLAEAGNLGLPVFRAALAARAPADLAGARALVFAGIGRPEKVFRSARDAGLEVVATRGFGDHHRYSEADAEALLAEAEALGAQLVTTGKDRARLAGVTAPALATLATRARVLGVEMRLEDPEALVAFLGEAIRAKSATSDTNFAKSDAKFDD